MTLPMAPAVLYPHLPLSKRITLQCACMALAAHNPAIPAPTITTVRALAMIATMNDIALGTKKW